MEQIINPRIIFPKKEEKYFQTSVPFRDLKSQVNDNLSLSTEGINLNEDNLNQLYKYFRKRYTRNQTLTVLSSIIAESGTNPLKTELILENNKLVPKGPGFGLLQYTNKSRKNKMLEHKSNDFPDSELMRQAEFIYGEMQGNKKFLSPLDSTQWLKKNGAYRKQFFNPNSSLEELNEAFVKSFVRPSDVDLDIKKRTEISKYLDSILSEEYKSGGKFGFNKSRLVKNAEAQNKRDMRKKFIKSDRPTYTKPLVKKKQYGGTITSDINVDEVKFNPDLFTSWNSIQTNVIETPYVDYQSKFPRVDNLMSKINSTTPSKSDTPAEEREVKILPFKFDAPSTVTSFVNPYKGKRGSWVNDMKQAYRDAGIKNENAIRMLIAQDALESRWGEAAQGAYNFGNLTTGKSWKGQFVEGRDKDAAGNPISQKFRSYGSTKDYAADKIDFLKRLYDFDENDNIDTFLHKLQGGNKGGRSYAEDKRYRESVLNTYNSFKG